MSEFNVHQLINFLQSIQIEFIVQGNLDRIFTHPSSYLDTNEKSISFIRSGSIKVQSPTKFYGVLLCPPLPHNEEFEGSLRIGDSTIFLLDNTEIVFYQVLNHFFSQMSPRGFHKLSSVEIGSILESGVSIGPFSHISANVKLGVDVSIGSNCTLRNCTIGDGSVIADGVKIGGEALGALQDLTGKWIDRPSFGKVLIGRNVRIEENSVIQRGFLQNTVLQDNIRVGPNSWIGNGVHIEEGTLIGQGVVIAGSVRVGSNSRIWGNSSVREGVKIGTSVVVGLGSVVLKDIPDREVHVGNPSRLLK